MDIPAPGAEGVLFAHGARFGGHALYVKDNRLHYVYNFVGMMEQQIDATEDIPTGEDLILSAAFDKDGEDPPNVATGILSLYHGDRKVGEGRIKTQPGYFSLAGEGLCVGRDSGEAVTDDYPGSSPYTFTGGTIKRVAVDVSGEPYLDLERQAVAMLAREVATGRSRPGDEAGHVGASETATQGDRASDDGSGGRLTKLDPRALRRADIRIFSSASDAPNARRPTDVILLIVAVIGVVILSFLAPGPTAIDKTVSDLLKELPGLLGWFWNICYDLMIAWAIVLLILALVARGRKRLFFTELITGALALGFALLAGKVAGTDWSTSLKALGASGIASRLPRDQVGDRHGDRRDGVTAHEPTAPVHRTLGGDVRSVGRHRARRDLPDRHGGGPPDRVGLGGHHPPDPRLAGGSPHARPDRHRPG